MLPSATQLLLATPLLLAPAVFTLSLLLGVKASDALRAATIIAASMLGLNLVVWLLWSNLSETASAIAARTGVTRDIMDLGWPSAAAIAYGSSVGLVVIPVAIGLNLLLLRLRMTHTLNIDIWNFWHFAFVGALIAAATGSLSMGLAAMVLTIVLSLLMADWTAAGLQDFYGVDGVSVPHLASVQIYPIAVCVNWLMDRVPGIRSINVPPEYLSQKLGLLADPVVLGFSIGVALSTFAYLNLDDPLESLRMIVLSGGIFTAAMLMLPKTAQLLMEGLAPITEAARGFAERWSQDRRINVGLDSAILIGHPSIMMASALLVPISIVLSIILPGNRVILFADLTVIPFVIAMAAPVVKGNVFRLVVIGIAMMVPGFYIAGHLAGSFTGIAVDAGFTKPADAAQITSIVDGFIWPSFALNEIAVRFGWIGLAVSLAGLIGGLLWSRQRIKLTG